MIQKPFDLISNSDIDDLLIDGVPEGRTIEYKLTLPGNTDQDKKEFLADISSFANAAGGDLFYGVEEDKGVPLAIPGLQIADADAEIRRLESMIQSGIDPRVPGIQIKAMKGFSQGSVIFVRIPQSWSAPHMVAFKNASRFFTRRNANKLQMDVTEIRSAFLLTEAIPERIRRFRDDRLSKIIGGDTPMPMVAGPKMILHILPVASFSKKTTVDVVGVSQNFADLIPLGAGGANGCRMNLDGCLTFSIGDNRKCDAYAQLFRSGVIEAVDGFTLMSGEPGIPGVTFEEVLIRATSFYLKLLQRLGIEPPLIVMLSMIGVRGLPMLTRSRSYGSIPHVIDRDVPLFPEIVLEDLTGDPASILRPIIDTVWQSAGFARSPSYK